MSCYTNMLWEFGDCRQIPITYQDKYEPIYINKRDAEATIPLGLDITTFDLPVQLFQLFVTREHCSTIAANTNIKAARHNSAHPPCSRTPKWRDITGAEIEIFLWILLLMGLARFPAEEEYWSANIDKPLLYPIQEAMSRHQYQDIKRHLKISNPAIEPARISKGKGFWKKLEPLASDIRHACKRYYQPGSKISIDEQLIRFKGAKQTHNADGGKSCWKRI